MQLKLGERYLVSSAIAKGYEEIVGQPFTFVIEVYSLSPVFPTPSSPMSRDLQFRVVDYQPRGLIFDRPQYECYCIAHGHDRYGAASLNFSENLIEGGTWYVPYLFCWQTWFMYLVLYDVVERVDNNYRVS